MLSFRLRQGPVRTAGAASTFCPLLVLVWWPRLSVAGAVAGLASGGALAIAATLVTVLGLGGGGTASHGWLTALLAQPTAWTVPIAFLVAIVVSLATPGSVPRGTAQTMVRLHAPESVASL